MFNQFKPIKVSNEFIQWLKSIGVPVRDVELPLIPAERITEVQPMEPLARRFYIREMKKQQNIQ
jgi:hypothetical protein